MDSKEIIEALGGTFAVAKLFDIQPSSVSEWKKTGIPKARLMYLKVKYPELFEKEQQNAK